ncbi:MAG TPA: type VI secretion system-associated FHA domain protein TagH [Gammaproteobacteria bacterium]|nr:type VI secretion system-associated FHA domain protein TagH [Gammaproteobacteria bacterium]
MPLLVTVRKSPEAIAITGSSKTFDAQGGTMGRGAANTWILEDPERYLSSKHCQLSSEGGQFYIADLSTNGTFLNGSGSAMGKGTRQPLNEGDTFTLGDYEFSVSLIEQSSAGEVPDPGPFVDNHQENYPSSGGGTPFVTSLPDEGPVLDPDKKSDPYPGFGNDSSGGFPATQGGQNITDDGGGWGWGGEPGSDEVIEHNIDIPGARPDATPFVGSGGGIPENWNDDLPESQPVTSPPDETPDFYTPPIGDPWGAADAQPEDTPAITSGITPGGRKNGHMTPTFVEPDMSPDTGKLPDDSVSAAEYQALVDSNAQLQAELDMLKRTQSNNLGSGEYTMTGASNTNLLETMGFQVHELSEEEKARISSQAGEVVREMIIGLMKVLGARSTIKNEFRMNVTTIQPVENNPLKFSANISDALENMFIKQGNAYIEPVEAVREGFNGIAEHQVAILAGMRAAFKGVIERFDPEMLNERFSRQQKGSIFTISQDAKNWEAYLEYYKNLAGDTDSSFQSLFGDEFVNAYEEQLHKLSFARKSAG